MKRPLLSIFSTLALTVLLHSQDYRATQDGSIATITEDGVVKDVAFRKGDIVSTENGWIVSEEDGWEKVRLTAAGGSRRMTFDLFKLSDSETLIIVH